MVEPAVVLSCFDRAKMWADLGMSDALGLDPLQFGFVIPVV
jgi:hypothetical protein